MNGAGDEQTNGQNELADQTEAYQARQKTFSFGVFQWMKSAMSAIPCQLLQVFGSVRPGWILAFSLFLNASFSASDVWSRRFGFEQYPVVHVAM